MNLMTSTFNKRNNLLFVWDILADPLIVQKVSMEIKQMDSQNKDGLIFTLLVNISMKSGV
jgi:hypothetical protein